MELSETRRDVTELVNVIVETAPTTKDLVKELLNVPLGALAALVAAARHYREAGYFRQSDRDAHSRQLEKRIRKVCSAYNV